MHTRPELIFYRLLNSGFAPLALSLRLNYLNMFTFYMRFKDISTYGWLITIYIIISFSLGACVGTQQHGYPHVGTGSGG